MHRVITHSISMLGAALLFFQGTVMSQDRTGARQRDTILDTINARQWARLEVLLDADFEAEIDGQKLSSRESAIKELKSNGELRRAFVEALRGARDCMHDENSVVMKCENLVISSADARKSFELYFDGTTQIETHGKPDWRLEFVESSQFDNDSK